MFNFIEKENPQAKIDESILSKIELQHNLVFPELLRKYYLEQNGSIIKKATFYRYTFEFEIVSIIPLGFCKYSVEKILETMNRNEHPETTLVPLALDYDGGYYFWDKLDEKVYYMLYEYIESKKEVFFNIEEFFKTLINQ